MSAQPNKENQNHPPLKDISFEVGGFHVKLMTQEFKGPLGTITKVIPEVEAPSEKDAVAVLKYLIDEGILDALQDLGLPNPPEPFWTINALDILHGKTDAYGATPHMLGSAPKPHGKLIVTYLDNTQEQFDGMYVQIVEHKKETNQLAITWHNKPLLLNNVASFTEENHS